MEQDLDTGALIIRKYLDFDMWIDDILAGLRENEYIFWDYAFRKEMKDFSNSEEVR